ncbi:MAG: hypothetical protein ACYTEK_09060, partial [Planctomycetota bacterium]
MRKDDSSWESPHGADPGEQRIDSRNAGRIVIGWSYRKDARSASSMEGQRSQLESGSQAFMGLLEAFRRGDIARRRYERHTLEQHLGGLSGRWDQQFPGFPQEQSAYASFRGVRRRGVRDGYLKQIIARLLEARTLDSADRTIINPACVIGRHARDLATRLPNFKVIATDIFPAS